MEIIISDAIENGVRWLDQTIPNWKAIIRIKELDMSNSFGCILGQIYPKGFRYALRRHHLTVNQVLEMGFYLPIPARGCTNKDVYDELTRAWVQRLSQDSREIKEET